MKKILISLLVMVLTILFTTISYSANTQTSENKEINVNIKLTENKDIEQNSNQVELILSVGEIKGDMSDLIQCGIGADLEYNDDITNVQATKLDETNVANITCANKKLLIEMISIKENTNLVKLTLTLKENISPSTMRFKLTNITFTKNGEGNQENSQVTNSTLISNITIKKEEEAKTEETTKPTQQTQTINPTQTTKPTETTQVVTSNETTKPTQQTQVTTSTENTKSTQQETNLSNTTKSTQETEKTEITKKDKTTSKESLPKTGSEMIGLIVIFAMILVAIICLIKYKNIEIKPN